MPRATRALTVDDEPDPAERLARLEADAARHRDRAKAAEDEADSLRRQNEQLRGRLSKPDAHAQHVAGGVAVARMTALPPPVKRRPPEPLGDGDYWWCVTLLMKDGQRDPAMPARIVRTAVPASSEAANVYAAGMGINSTEGSFVARPVEVGSMVEPRSGAVTAPEPEGELVAA